MEVLVSASNVIDEIDVDVVLVVKVVVVSDPR